MNLYTKDLLPEVFAESFFKKFKERMKENAVDSVTGKSYFELYKGNRGEFTEFILKRIICELIESYGLTSEFEYYRIDAIGYETVTNDELKSECDKQGLNYHLWKLMIAVEHENDPNDWLDELIKLTHVMSPLKVIIAYSAFNDRDAGDKEKLQLAAKMIEATEAFVENDDGYLVILGNCKSSNDPKNDYDSFDYRGYLYNPGISYDGGGFEEII